MQLRCDIAPDLANRWRPVIERQLDLTLAPLRDRLRSARVRFAQEGPRAGRVGAGESYCCEFTVRDRVGATHRSVARHRDGTVAIADALTRARRSITRLRRTRPGGA